MVINAFSTHVRRVPTLDLIPTQEILLVEPLALTYDVNNL